MKLVLGIGNPGKRYQATRHNVGFRVLDRLALRAAARFTTTRFQAVGATWREGENTLLLVKPLSYVNRCGQVARAVLDYYHLEPGDLLVVLDDLNLPLGRLRLRAGGSSGGHNGLKDLEACLGTQAYPRLRVGIGAPSGDQSAFVLAKPKAGEGQALCEAEDRAADACECWWRRGLDLAATLVNSDPAAQREKASPSPPGESDLPGGPTRDHGHEEPRGVADP